MNDNLPFIDIVHCRKSDSLADTLREAAQLVDRVGQDAVLHVIPYQDAQRGGAWGVDVIYYPIHANP
jgi:hypothetical protein